MRPVVALLLGAAGVVPHKNWLAGCASGRLAGWGTPVSGVVVPPLLVL